MRILLVEDDLSLGEGIRTALRRGAFAVDWVQDGASGLLALRGGGFDLVVLDLGLPRMDGIEVIRQLRAAGDAVPVLVLSARERPADRTLGLGSEVQVLSSIETAWDFDDFDRTRIAVTFTVSMRTAL